MAAYDTLRAAIDNYIKANGNKEITGTVLNDILNAMVSALGADTRFAGVAVPSTNPGNPEGNVVYFASQAGTYSNFGGIVLPLGIHILVWNGTAWTSQTWFSVDNTPTQNSQNLALSGGILQAIVDAVGVERLRAIGAEVTSCSFDGTTKKISFFNSADDTLFQLDATAFVIDGMVSDVKIEDGNLVIQFNTDAGKQDIEIPLTDIFNPANYYTKTAIDALLALYYTKTEVDGLLSTINTKLADGYLYKGIATPATSPATPATKEFYLATIAGTYTNFGNIVVKEGITILKYDGTNWTGEQLTYTDGVFDISAYNGTSYADLSAALGNGGANIPQNLRKGGMSVKFVQSSDNKYVQYRLMNQNWSATVSDWEEETQVVYDGSDGKTSISFVDENGNCAAQIKDGHIKTKNFNSSLAATKEEVENSKITDNLDNNREKLSFVDEDGNCNLQIKDGHIITKNFDSSIVKSYGTKISDFKDFEGSAWNITNNKSATTTTLNSRLIHNVGSHEDSFNLSATIIPYGTSFEVAIGKYQFIGGTFFTLYYDGSTSKVKIYNINDTGQYVLINIDWVCNSIQFASGKKIFVTISKSVTTDDNFTVSLYDEYGNTETFTVNGCVYKGVGSGWGKVFFELLSGSSVTIQNVSFGYNLKNDLELIIIGHSYVEGNNLVQSDSQDKDKKYAALITQDLGKEHCLTLGMGGDTVSALISEGRIDQECKWFKNSKYALLHIGNNDVSDTVGTPNFDTAVAATKHNMLIVDSKIKKAGIIPVWVTVNWYPLYGKPVNDTINSWMLETFEHVIDNRKIFEDGNGNLDSSKYASDGVHPSIASHLATYELVKAQAPFIFDF